MRGIGEDQRRWLLLMSKSVAACGRLNVSGPESGQEDDLKDEAGLAAATRKVGCEVIESLWVMESACSR